MCIAAIIVSTIIVFGLICFIWLAAEIWVMHDECDEQIIHDITEQEKRKDGH